MTRVDFYLLPERAEGAEGFACRLAEKAWRHGLHVHLRAPDAGAAERLDRLLWTFRAGSFLPHALVGQLPEGAAGDRPVLVDGPGGPPPEPWRGLLINLAGDVPPWFEAFLRVAEPVAPDPQARAAARRRYRLYRERGCQLHTHRLEARGP
ncbi:MAG: DNA polymerase III subunit chi [Gammaproteobacteria bacterium]|nr:MAG: DNA polymerase III subunit chi [Gammaproteobacteria bacterium]